MSPEKRKMIKNIEAKGLTLTIIVLMVLASLTTIIVINPTEDITVKGASVADFLYNKAITIDKDQVLADIDNFIFCLNLSSDADLASDALDTGYDIAFFNATNVQLPHEIEYFNGDTGRLVAWINITSGVSSSVDTVIDMYYGDSDIGGSAEDRQAVWSGYDSVFHGRNLSDSSGNAHSLSNSGSVGLNDSAGMIGGCFDYGEADDRYLSGAAVLDSIPGAFTISLLVKPTTLGDDGADATNDDDYLFYRYEDGSNTIFWFYNKDTHQLKTRIKAGGTNFDVDAFHNSTSYTEDEWHWVHLIWKDSAYVNMSVDWNTTTPTASTKNYAEDSGSTSYFGKRDGEDSEFDGYMDEIRIYLGTRTLERLHTEYNNLINCTDGGFFSLGGASGSTGTYNIGGIGGSSKFTFSGEAGETWWANDTADGTFGETLYIYTNTSGGSDNVTDIFLDFTDADADVMQENFSIEVINLTDGVWDGTTTTIPAADGNLTINSSQWAGGWCHGTNPFPIVGYNSTICVRVKCAIPSGASAGTKSNSATCYVKWKVNLP